MSGKVDFVKKAREVHGDLYEYTGEYVGYYSDIEIICPVHGAFLQKPNNHLAGNKCKHCGSASRQASYKSQRNKRQIALKEEFVKKARALHGDRYEYLGDYINYDSKIEIACALHGNFLQTPDNHLHGSGCKKCGVEQSTIIRSSTTVDFIRKACEVHNDKYEYPGVYVTALLKIEILCPVHGLFAQTPNHHLKGIGCPYCSHRVSRPETAWLDQMGIMLRQHPLKIRGGTKTIRVDGYDPATKTVYQFHGDYWHGNPKVYTDPFAWNERAKCQMSYLYKKTLESEKAIRAAGYTLIVIWESEWKSLIRT